MTLDELVARECIRQVKARYCYHLDRKEWYAYADLFTADATMDVDEAVSTRGRDPRPRPRLAGREAIRAHLPALLGDADTVHQVHSGLIEFTSPTEATGIWAMEDIVCMPGLLLEGRGHYRETYRVDVGRWRIGSLHLTRTWLRIVEGEAAAAAALSGAASATTGLTREGGVA